MEINFLDVIFNLRNGSYRPYKRPNDELKYINGLSNYPLQILKQLTTTISDRLSRNSSNGLIFNESKHQYEDALSKIDFKTELTYKDSAAPTNRKTISREKKLSGSTLRITKMCQQISPRYSKNWLTNIFHAPIDIQDI